MSNLSDLTSIINLTIKDHNLKLQLNNWIASMRDVPKRYFIVNAFDEIVAFLGLILGIYFGGFLSARILLTSIVNAGIAMCISGFTAAFLTEEAEVARILDNVKPKLIVFKTTLLRRIEYTCRIHILKSGIASGFAALLSSFLVAFPYLLAIENIISIIDAFTSSIIIVIVLLFILGLILGRIARGRELKYCLVTTMAGLATGFLCMLLSFIE